jgi:hypothetical protein
MKRVEMELTCLDRFERVSSAQKMGSKNREVFHHTDWDIVAKNSEAMTKMVGAGLYTTTQSSMPMIHTGASQSIYERADLSNAKIPCRDIFTSPGLSSSFLRFQAQISLSLMGGFGIEQCRTFGYR